jgi:P27 family predicted phage terminase small subunit
MKKDFTLPAKFVRKQKRIRDYMISKNAYEDIDENLIEELIFNFFLAEESKINILDKGSIISNIKLVKGVPIEMIMANPSVAIYSQATKSINSICTKLGINPQERIKLKLAVQDDESNPLESFN